MDILHYRVASAKDAADIALLHAQSWQRHYRGIWADAFLDGPVTANRREVWNKRLTEPAENQQIILAELNGQLVGFVCMFAEADAQYGALLDNLHVSSALQGRGIGKALMQRAAAWLFDRDPDSTFYLWVLERNEAARKFYDHLGGEQAELLEVVNPDGSYSPCYRYLWRDLKGFIE